MKNNRSLNLQLSSELRSIGFSEKTALVYAALMEMGWAFPSHLAEYTRLNRTTVYKILHDLCSKGLVTEIDRNNKLCYQIEKPAQLLSFIKHQAKAAEEHYKTAQKLFPDLKNLFGSLVDRPSVRYFEGRRGVLAVYEDQMENFSGYDLDVFMNISELSKFLPIEFRNKYLDARIKAGIQLRCIAPEPPDRAVLLRWYRKVDKHLWPHYKFVSPESFPFKSHISIYGKDRVSLINVHKYSVLGIIIEDQTVANMMRMIFNLAWAGIQN